MLAPRTISSRIPVKENCLHVKSNAFVLSSFLLTRQRESEFFISRTTLVMSVSEAGLWSMSLSRLIKLKQDCVFSSLSICPSQSLRVYSRSLVCKSQCITIINIISSYDTPGCIRKAEHSGFRAQAKSSKITFLWQDQNKNERIKRWKNKSSRTKSDLAIWTCFFSGYRSTLIRFQVRQLAVEQSIILNTDSVYISQINPCNSVLVSFRLNWNLQCQQCTDQG